MKSPNFRSTPPLVVGTPVFLAKLCLAAVIPSNRFNENENPNFPILIEFKQQYLIQMEEVVIHLNR
jgi:hypothetical protein